LFNQIIENKYNVKGIIINEEYRKKKKLNVITNKSPNILNNNFYYISKFEDYYNTPDEIIFKNLTDNEVDIIKSDPAYFKLNKDLFENLGILKNRNLLEILNDEEKRITSEEFRKKMLKSRMPSSLR
jgi:hypothetical protein